jgi:hypothetical protein
MTYDPGLVARNSYHTWTVAVTDDAGNTVSTSGNYTAVIYPSDNIFVIEAEDYNTGSGQIADSIINTMPYTGNAYTNLAAVHDVDYHSDDANDSDVYRKGEDPNKNDEPNDGGRWGADRGSWTMEYNYKLGWVNNVDWFNYTRVFPAADYEVYLAASLGSSGTIRAGLDEVTGDPTQPDQATQNLGSFVGPSHPNGTGGGWSQNSFVPLVDGDGMLLTIPLQGETTLRLSGDTGDLDYMVFIPVGDLGPELSIEVGAGGDLTITWTGSGVVQEATNVAGPYTDNAAIQSGVAFTPAGNEMYYRLVEN